MSEERSKTDSQEESPTLALNTKVEEDFISPLTAIRGSLEILRDFPALGPDERQRFVEIALRGCAKLEQGVSDLAGSVYASARRGAEEPPPTAAQVQATGYEARIHALPQNGVIELDFSDFTFDTSAKVNEFFDAVDQVILASGQSWYFLINYHNCTVWPEAWVAFAHRGKRLKVGLSLGTARYAERDQADEARAEVPGASSRDSDLFDSREAALAHIEAMKLNRKPPQAS